MNQQSSSTEQINFCMPSISDFFAGKSIALTGGTGFIGQLLVEKLLRSCSKVKQIFLLMRSKKGLCCQERLKKLTSLPIFDQLKSVNPNFSSKLVAIPCDLAKEDLGMSDESYKQITSEANIFFHCAATLRFDEHLKLSLEVNTFGVRRVLNLCRQIENLQAVVHVSTAYSYCNYNVVEERVYPTGWNYDKLHGAMQWMTDDMVEKLKPDILGDRPNTYTLTKAFAEEVVVKEGIGLPICIVRPSIIGATYAEPLSGWCANANGPTALIIAFGKGCLHVLHNSSNNCMDIIPADYVVNGLVAAAWKTAHSQIDRKPFPDQSLMDQASFLSCDKTERAGLQKLGYVKPTESNEIIGRRKTIPIYHLVSNAGQSLTIKLFHDLVASSLYDYPLDNAIQAPYISSISNKSLYRIVSFFMEYVPAGALDMGRVLTGKRPIALRLTRQIMNTQKTFSYFFWNTWMWKQNNALSLEKELSDHDRKEFAFGMHAMDWPDYVKIYCMGTRKYLLKEDPKGYPAARRRVWRLRLLGWFLQFASFVIFWRLVASKSTIGKNLWRLLLTFWFKFLRFFQISSTLHKKYVFSKLFA